MWTSTEIRESLSDSTKLWVTVSSLSNTVRRWTSKRERDRHNEWRGFQKLFQLWIVRWQDWQEINLWMPSRIRWLKWRVQWLFQGLLAWWKKRLNSSKNVTYLCATAELEGGQRWATDPIWSLKVYDIDRTLVNKNEPVLYYLKDGPKCGFIREELQIVPPGTELPPEGIY